MTKKEFVKWIKYFFVDVEWNESVEKKLTYMVDQIDPVIENRVIAKPVYKTKFVYVDKMPKGVIKVDLDYNVQIEKKPLDSIAEEVCKRHGIEVFQLKSVTRTRTLVMARKAFVKAALSSYPYTFKEIGNFLNRDHSSIIYLYNCAVNQNLYVDADQYKNAI
jgi:Bacterial dnaA protein helix-turn-helix